MIFVTGRRPPLLAVVSSLIKESLLAAWFVTLFSYGDGKRSKQIL
jgi:hypothetical protein